ncbi:hypothetical protein RHGRI_034582 [Rhododendron griersonianum]|uniref:Purple acid phosphatase n=1 Tax=Rhododendron griersonianum TaxID=479676 RepID=A0AAV6I164_9ERIC|nr:hypothetical protein RHGRI_034582 [Rhododendron griersonianum]KAG5522447.1 hypothetical protein RHGRI_034582 [Rhododendron griersonianum]
MLPFFLFSLLSLASPASISVTPQTLSKSNDPITIRWSQVTSPSTLDWLGIYSPPNSSHDDFIGYLFLSASPAWRSGSGSLTIPLTNLRSDYQFRIFRWSDSEINPKRQDHDHNPLPGTKHLLAASGSVGFGTGRGPEQVHLAYTGSGGEMRVMFVTRDGEESFVRYGEREGGLSDWRSVGTVVGSDSGGWSTTYSFVSKNDNSDETIAFLFGDMGTATPYSTFLRTQDESISTLKWISRDIEALGDKPAFISHIGDISYARGYSWLWDNFFAQIEPLSSKVPYHVCVGNHEYDWPLQPWKPEWSYAVYGKDGGGECGVPYSLKFNMPGNSSELTGTRAPPTRNLYYSFDSGSVHFVYISTETNFLPGSNQYDFIKHDLESVDRKKTPFVVVQGHRPMYTTSHENRDAPFRERLLEHLEPLFVKNKVTLALWGHVHRYERFCPLNNFTCGSMGLNGEKWEAFPVHVVIGMAGQDWQPIWEPRADHPDDPIFPQASRSLYRGGEFGYTRLVANKEKLTFSYVGNHDGEVHDTVEILASGQVLNGDGGGSTAGRNMVQLSFSWYVKGASVLVLGAFVGYVMGYITRARRDGVSGKSWTPVKSEEI